MLSFKFYFFKLKVNNWKCTVLFCRTSMPMVWYRRFYHTNKYYHVFTCYFNQFLMPFVYNTIKPQYINYYSVIYGFWVELDCSKTGAGGSHYRDSSVVSWCVQRNPWRSYHPFSFRICHLKVCTLLQYLHFKWEFLKTLHACLLP